MDVLKPISKEALDLHDQKYGIAFVTPKFNRLVTFRGVSIFLYSLFVQHAVFSCISNFLFRIHCIEFKVIGAN